jgi:DNA modification methylase
MMNKRMKKASEFRHKPVKDLLKLTNLFFQETNNSFAIGDEIARLVEHKSWKISDLADYFNRSRSRLSEIYHTAKLFKPGERNYTIPFSHYEFTRKACRDFDLDPIKTVAEIQKQDLNQQRDVTRYFADKRRRKENMKSADLSASRTVGREELINCCHNEDCRSVANRLGDGTVKIAFVDAPYAKYGSYKNGQHDKGGAARNDCDGSTNADVIELIDDILRILIRKLSKGGVVLLCRPGGILDPLHTVITGAADKFGWKICKILTWHKGKAKLGGGNEPYTVDAENIWVLHRQGDKIENHDNSSRSVVLQFAPVAQRSITAQESHLFIKPPDLCKFLVSKHSYEGEICFDACGCSGNFSIAALELNRQFVFCETNKQNFELGSGRVYGAINKQKSKAG